MLSLYSIAERLFPICRSITGSGVRETLSILREYIPTLDVFEVPSGTQVFDWRVPKEWRIRDAWVKNSSGEKIIDFKRSNLHVVGYSAPIDKEVGLEELLQYVYVEDTLPDAIPYVTSYYKERYGFCMSKSQRDRLPDDRYHIFIDSELFDGSLTYGEAVIPGECEQEIFFSTYICHPSMANNELSGPCVLTGLYRYLTEIKHRRYTYRLIFIPETIGSITYLSRNLPHLKRCVKAGFVVTCAGDDRTYSYVASRYGDTLADKVVKNTLRYHYPDHKTYSFLQRGSDERQYNAPGVDLPVCAVCRSKYGEYPEYHTSADDMSLISEDGMRGMLEMLQKCVRALEANAYYRVNCLCEPQLGRRGLYPTVSKKNTYGSARTMSDIIAYCDGTNDLIDISDIIGAPLDAIVEMVKTLESGEVLSRVPHEEETT